MELAGTGIFGKPEGPGAAVWELAQLVAGLR
jgi:hypothetical protein